MRRLALTLALVVPLAAWPAQSSSATKRTCVFKGSKTVVKSSSARVFAVRTNRGDEIDRLYGCLHSANRRFLLDTSFDDGFVSSASFGEVTMNGRFVAWEHVNNDISCKADCPPDFDPVTETVGIADLRARKRKGFTGNPKAGTLAVDRSGTATWTDEDTGEPRSASLR
jgi:hypothetical protein